MITSSDFVEKVDFLLKKNQQTRSALYDTVGIAKNTFPNWTSRDVKIPLDIAYKIAQFLGVSINYFFEDSEINEKKEEESKQNEISDEEMELIKLWRNLPEEKQNALKVLIRG